MQHLDMVSHANSSAICPWWSMETPTSSILDHIAMERSPSGVHLNLTNKALCQWKSWNIHTWRHMPHLLYFAATCKENGHKVHVWL